MNPRGPERPQAAWCLRLASPGLLPTWLGDPGTERFIHALHFIIVSQETENHVCERLFYHGLLVVPLIRLRVPATYREFLFATLTSAFMSLIITFIIAAVDAGLSHRFWDLWLRGFLVGTAVGIPTSLVVIPLVRRLVDRLTAF